MSRPPGRPGFEVADTDTGLMSDPKVVALARSLRDTGQTFAALGVYEAVLLASWKQGERLTAEESLPGWALDPVDDEIVALIETGLLDAEHRIPEAAWDKWFGTAFGRRQEKRDLAAAGGRATAAKTRGGTPSTTPSGAPGITPPSTAPGAVRPSVRPPRPGRDGTGQASVGLAAGSSPDDVERPPPLSPERDEELWSGLRAELKNDGFLT